LYRSYIGFSIELPFKFLNYETEGFGDFNHFYLVWAENFLSKNWYPYSYGNIIEQLNWYSYTPFFLYTISLFKFSFLPEWSPAIPIILFDSGCAVMIYKILKNLVSTKNAFWGSILFSFSAINIFYIGIYRLNPSPMTFFLLVSFYYLINYRYHNSIIYLVISVMMKQTGLYYVPIFIAFLIKRVKENRKIIKLLLFFIAIGIFFQTPYIFLTPLNYFRHLFATPTPTLSMEIPVPLDNSPITLSQFIHYGLQINASISGFFNYLISTYFLFIFFIMVITSYIIFLSNKKELYNYDLLFIFTLNGFISYLFQPKGLYKYYISTLIPFIIMSIIYGVNCMKTSNIKKYVVIIVYFLLNIFTIFMPRIYIHGLVLMALILIIYLYKVSKKNTPLPIKPG
jgi:hypothetical protein